MMKMNSTYSLAVILTFGVSTANAAIKPVQCSVAANPKVSTSSLTEAPAAPKESMQDPAASAKATEDLNYLVGAADRFAPLSAQPSGPHMKVMMGVIEIGSIPGLKTVDGKPLKLEVGGIGTVMNDTWSAKAPALAARGIETIAVTPLMRNVSKDGMNRIGTVEIVVEGKTWKINVLEYKMPAGGRILFLDNANIAKRFNAMPEAGKNIYEMEGLPKGAEGELEKQKIWSALSQATAKVYELTGANAYIPQDGHLAPASYYIYRAGHKELTLAPVLHNERYLDSFYTPWDMRPNAARIWNVTEADLDELFMHGDHVVMTAAAVRSAERTGVFTAKSVANNTARVLNRDGLPAEAFPQIEIFSRIAPEENFLAESNRPYENVGLARATVEQLASEDITDPEVIAGFATEHGYQFGGPLEESGRMIPTGKVEAKRAVQKIFGMDLDARKPLFVSFARLVEQKGLDFLPSNVERILERGGQIVVGGPVGDGSGAAAQAAFLKLKARLDRERPELSKNFFVIPGKVMGRKKALLLAAQDFFPVPSRFEPCGLTDVEALFNGGQPIAPRIGGLVKGKNTIKYAVNDANDQSADLGWGIDQALNLYDQHYELFLKRQIAAAKEDFSLEKHLDQVLLNQRIEIDYRIIQSLEGMVANGQMSKRAAQTFIQKNIFEKRPGDAAEFVGALLQIHPNRRSPLVAWLIQRALKPQTKAA